MKKLGIYSLIFIVLFILLYHALVRVYYGEHPFRQWELQSVDTMKYSRDRSREFLQGKISVTEIDKQVDSISETGATHVAIGTPYDEEFLPIMKLWVSAARKHNLKVWFRGNFSGWEEWFEYKKMTKSEHLEKTKAFIENNPDIFQDGDIFTSCTECENGSKVQYGDHRSIAEHRTFLLSEYSITKEAFRNINKDVKSNYYSMNGDLAKAMMDMETTLAFDGIVVIDHYVKDPKELAQDIRALGKQSGGTIILGEFGAPIPAIHGEMSEEAQTKWIQEALREVAGIPEVGGINYWTNKDSSTAIWTMEGKAKAGVGVLTRFFKGREYVIKYSD